MTWKEISLDEVVKIKGGKRLPKNTDFVNFETHHPYIRARDIGDGKIEIKDPVYLTEEVYSLIKNYTVSSGDLVITIVGANIGDTAEIKPQFHGANLTENAVKLTVKDVNKLDPVFLKYSLFGDNQKQKLQQIAAGAAQGKLGLYKIKEFKISLPSNIVIQQRIASILSAYDNLIENNLKRIRLLEEAAQMIYREWFVKMRFPGYEEVEWYVDEKGRRLPEGWKFISIGDFCSISGGGTPSTKIPTYWDNGDIFWFSPTDLSKNDSIVLLDSTDKITLDGLANSSAKLLPPRTILMSSRATIGLFGIISQSCATNQGFINIIPNNEWERFYILFNLKSRVNEIIGNASGATFKEISKGVFKTMPILVPSQEVLKIFNKICTNIIDSIENLENQNVRLKQARDILLPRLMDGRVEVE